MANNTVFISYSREDVAFMEKLKNQLEDKNIKVWIDQNIPGGTDWDSAIEKALESSKMHCEARWLRLTRNGGGTPI